MFALLDSFVMGKGEESPVLSSILLPATFQDLQLESEKCLA